MNVTPLTLLIHEINHLIDSGKYTDITIDDVHEAIENKRLLRYLRERAGNDIDLSALLDSDVYGNFEEFYETRMNDIYGGYAGDERRKWGVENLGLCLALAWTNEIIQLGRDLELRQL